MECCSFSKPGAEHLKAGQRRQDQMFGLHGEDRLALCLCDGCGSSPLGGEAARYTAVRTARLFYHEFYDLLLAQPDAVRQRLSAVLQPELRAFAVPRGVHPETLATTILTLAADSSGRYLCAHLGDGSILMQPEGAPANSVSVISSPSRRAGTRETDLTMNVDMTRHLKVYQSLLPTCGKILLLTDGADELLRPSARERTLPCALLGPELERCLDQLHPRDDYSGALVSITGTGGRLLSADGVLY